MLDYVIGLLLIGVPWLFGFALNEAETWVPVLLGVGVIGYSLLTDYELGILRTIPMPVHLMLDMGGGALLAASPWLFDFSNYVFLPHLVVGLIEICTAMMTQKHPTRHRPHVTAYRRMRTH